MSQLEELKKAFFHYSNNQQNISGSKLLQLFKKYDIQFSPSEIKDIIQSNDYNKNGKLEFNEFVNILLFKRKEDLSREY